jgi:hypothetical protein
MAWISAPFLPGAGTSIDYTSIVNLLQEKSTREKTEVTGSFPWPLAAL